MLLKKYKFTPGAPFICLKVEALANGSNSKPKFFIVDEMSRSELDAMMSEYADNEEAMAMHNYRGLTWNIIPVSEMPEGFFEKRLKEALAEVEYANEMAAWFKTAVVGTAVEGVIKT